MNIQAFFIREKFTPSKVFFLGTGTAQLKFNWKLIKEVKFHEVGFPPIDVIGHNPKFFLYQNKSEKIVVFKGRWHFYEGHNSDIYESLAGCFSFFKVKGIYMFFATGGLDKNAEKKEIRYVHRSFNGVTLNASKLSSGNEFQYNSQTLKNSNFCTGVVGPTFGTPAESAFMSVYGFTNIGMSFTLESNPFLKRGLPINLFVVTTDIAPGLVNYKGDHTPEHTHKFVLQTLQQAEQKVIELISFLGSN